MSLDKEIETITLPTNLSIGSVNVYVIYGEKLTLVDAGINNEECWNVFLNELRKIDIEIKDIDQILLTHHHMDHCGLVNRIVERHPVPVYAHHSAYLWLKQDENFFRWQQEFFQQLFTKLDVDLWLFEQIHHFLDEYKKSSSKITICNFLEDNDRIPGLKDWVVVSTAGHAQSHISFYNERNGSLISGDHILKEVINSSFIEPPFEKDFSKPNHLSNYLRDLKKCQTLSVKKVLPGHGKPFTNANKVISRKIEKIMRRLESIKGLIKEQTTGFELIQKLLPNTYAQNIRYAISDVIGYLYLLEELHLIDVLEKNNKCYFVGRN